MNMYVFLMIKAKLTIIFQSDSQNLSISVVYTEVTFKNDAHSHTLSFSVVYTEETFKNDAHMMQVRCY
jgi:hypothetical protein